MGEVRNIPHVHLLLPLAALLQPPTSPLSCLIGLRGEMGRCGPPSWKPLFLDSVSLMILNHFGIRLPPALSVCLSVLGIFKEASHYCCFLCSVFPLILAPLPCHFPIICGDHPQPQCPSSNSPPTEKQERNQKVGATTWEAQLRFKGSWLSLQSRSLRGPI